MNSEIELKIELVYGIGDLKAFAFFEITNLLLLNLSFLFKDSINS